MRMLKLLLFCVCSVFAVHEANVILSHQTEERIRQFVKNELQGELRGDIFWMNFFDRLAETR
jgi:hypothetical protein